MVLSNLEVLAEKEGNSTSFISVVPLFTVEIMNFGMYVPVEKALSSYIHQTQ